MGRTINIQKQQKKEKIRAKINNANTSDLIVIPAKPIESVENNSSIHRVAAYCRVSTDEETQTTSFELQKTTYTEMITSHPGWELAGIYSDEGISGTSFNHRLGMQQMIEDCKAGKIDMIITKSIARFARNIVDCLSTIETLKNLPHPVGVQFETEHIYTLDESGRMILAILSSVAEEESHSKSSIMNWSIENRFSKGLFLTPSLYGYDQDPMTDQLVINQEEAKVVKLCFGLYLSGWNCTRIAELLTELKIPTYNHNSVWNPGTIKGMLQNERHYGAVLAHKTFTPSFLNHRAKKNNGDRKQYLREQDHEPIVSKQVFEAANKKMEMVKSGRHESALPSLDIVDKGVLKGFVSMNGKWRGFTDQDFIEASESVLSSHSKKKKSNVNEVPIGDYEVVSTSLFSQASRAVMTVKDGALHFNAASMKKFGNVEFVEILMNPVDKKIAVRPCSKDSPYAFRWGSLLDEKWKVYRRKATGLIEPMFALMGWNPENKCCITGEYYSDRKGAQMLMFDLNAAEVFESKAENEVNASSPELNESDDHNGITFGEPACVGSIVFEPHHYINNWDIMCPTKLYRYCTEITQDEMSAVYAETESILNELKGVNENAGISI